MKLSSRWPARSSCTRTTRAPVRFSPPGLGAEWVIRKGLSDTLATRDKVLISQAVVPAAAPTRCSVGTQGQKPDLRFRPASGHSPRDNIFSSDCPAEPALVRRVKPPELNTPRATPKQIYVCPRSPAAQHHDCHQQSPPPTAV